MIAVAIVAGYANRRQLRLKIASVYASVPPKAAQAAPSKGRSAAFVGEAPWAFSALPECFDPLSKTTAPTLGYVLAHLPNDVSIVRAPRTLRYADCAVHVERSAVWIARGEDRLRVPAPAFLYAGGAHVALLRGDRGGYELLVYEHR